MFHPLHSAHIGRTENDAVSVAQTNEQSCSVCKSNMFSHKPAFFCQLCNFVLCLTCDKGHEHPAHDQHKLYFINQEGSWRCDVCKKSRADLRETNRFHCPICDFNMCNNCFPSVNRPLHAHRLIRTDVRNVYHQSSGNWRCDVCGNNNGPGNCYPWHCKTCRYDLCDNCWKPWYSLLHPGHAMFKADSNFVYHRFNGGWRCDKCMRSFTPDDNNQPFHCMECEFDLCNNCMGNNGNQSNRGGFDVPHANRMASGQVLTRGTSLTTRGNPITCPVEEEQEEQIGRPGPPAEDAGECVICLDKPKDATIVHGNTGHVCCCTSCALELRRKGLHCPICRAPIDRVIKQYIV